MHNRAFPITALINGEEITLSRSNWDRYLSKAVGVVTHRITAGWTYRQALGLDSRPKQVNKKPMVQPIKELNETAAIFLTRKLI